MIGQIFHKRYEILERLGQGGTAVVYKARDVVLNRWVTIKILQEQYANDEEFVRRFRHEAQAVAALSHPNIVSIYDVVFKEDMHYLVMEYIEGCTLKEYMKEQGGLSLVQALNFEIQILSALQHAHEHNVIHRDIKPQNILIDSNGQVKVTDFGIAVAGGAKPDDHKGLIGSVQYMAPEQVAGGAITERSDLYAAGAVLYEMLTGELPYHGDDAVSVAMQHVNGDIIPPHQKNDKVPKDLSFVVMRAMRKDPDMRYQSAQDMADSLRKIRSELLQGPVEAGTLADTNVEDILPQRPKAEERHPLPPRPQKSTKTIYITLGIFAILLVVAAFMGFRLINNLIRGEDVVVPSLEEKTLAEATEIMNDAGLSLAVERQYSDEVPLDYVISQSIAAGQTVKKGRTINIVVSDGAERIEVPNLKDSTRRDAEVLLKNLQLNVSIKEVESSTVSAGKVVDQNPAAGEEVPAGTVIYLEVSIGAETTMPQLVGLTLDQAKSKIAANNLTLGEVTRQESSSYVSDIVLEQSLTADQTVLEGTTVNLVVSDGPGPLPKKVRITYGVPQSGSSHTLRFVVVDDIGSHEEYSGTHSAGESVVQEVPLYGSGAIQIYLDGNLVYSQEVSSDSSVQAGESGSSSAGSQSGNGNTGTSDTSSGEEPAVTGQPTQTETPVNTDPAVPIPQSDGE